MPSDVWRTRRVSSNAQPRSQVSKLSGCSGNALMLAARTFNRWSLCSVA